MDHVYDHFPKHLVTSSSQDIHKKQFTKIFSFLALKKINEDKDCSILLLSYMLQDWNIYPETFFRTSLCNLAIYTYNIIAQNKEAYIVNEVHRTRR